MGSPGALASDHRDWVELVEPIVDDMRRRGVPNAMHLPPEVDDIRPWQWAGFVIGVDYTYYVDLPFEQNAVSSNVRRNCTKAEKAGLHVRRVTDVADLGNVMACLKETEERGGFSWGLDARLLALALDLLGAEHLRICLFRRLR